MQKGKKKPSMLSTVLAATAISFCISFHTLAGSETDIKEAASTFEDKGISSEKQKLVEYCSVRVDTAHVNCTDSAIDRMVKSSKLCFHSSLRPIPGQPPKRPDADAVSDCLHGVESELDERRFECSRRKAVELARCMRNPHHR